MSNSPFDSPAAASSPAPVADLAEQMDMSERSKYIKGKKIGSGQYADVFEATLVSDRKKLFAIKKIKIAAESADVGISYDSLREIRFLQELNHPNIIKLHAVFSTKDQNLNLVLEHLPQGDLLVLVHKPNATHNRNYPDLPIPPLNELIASYESVAARVRPTKVAAIALNTSDLDEEAARSAIAEAERETGLVADDVVRFGPDRVLQAVLAALDSLEKSPA